MRVRFHNLSNSLGWDDTGGPKITITAEGRGLSRGGW